MNRYYDKKNNRLVYIGEASNADFWDSHWDINTVEKMYPKVISPFDYVINTTKKYLKPKSIVVEGGCGVGQQVFKLHNANYQAIGIDYAERTIETVKKHKPNLDIRLGDVRNLDFEDNYVDGYWSFGVIEHFYDGYDEILQEMSRVIKPGGYLFLTFPHMCTLRKRKAKHNKYPIWKENKKERDLFYQFALDENLVLKDLKKLNFELVEKQHLSGIKGLKDEIKSIRSPLQKIYDSPFFVAKAISKVISLLFGRFSSHSIVLVLKNNK